MDKVALRLVYLGIGTIQVYISGVLTGWLQERIDVRGYENKAGVYL